MAEEKPVPLRAEVYGLERTRLLTNAVRCLSAFSPQELRVTVAPHHLTLHATSPTGWGYVLLPERFFSRYEYLGVEPRFVLVHTSMLGRILGRLEGEKPVTIETDKAELYLYTKDLELRKFTIRTTELEPGEYPRPEMEELEKRGVPAFTPYGGFVLWNLKETVKDLSRAFTVGKYEKGGLKLRREVLVPSFARARWVYPIDVYAHVERAEGVPTSLITRPPTYEEFNVELAKGIVTNLAGSLTSLGRYYGKKMLIQAGRRDDWLFFGGEYEGGLTLRIAVPTDGWPEVFEWEKPLTPELDFSLRIEATWDKVTDEIYKAYIEKKLIDYATHDEIKEWLKAELKGLAGEVERTEITVEEAVKASEKLFAEARERAKIAVPPPVPKLTREEFSKVYEELLDEWLAFNVELLSPGLAGEVHYIAPDRESEFVARFTSETVRETNREEIEKRREETYGTYQKAYARKPELGELYLKHLRDAQRRFARDIADKTFRMLVEEAKKIPPPPIEYVEVRFLTDVPAIVGADVKVYGPFKADETARLPRENAEILVKAEAATYELVPPPPPVVPPPVVRGLRPEDIPRLRAEFEMMLLAPPPTLKELKEFLRLIEELKVGYAMLPPEEAYRAALGDVKSLARTLLEKRPPVELICPLCGKPILPTEPWTEAGVPPRRAHWQCFEARGRPWIVWSSSEGEKGG